MQRNWFIFSILMVSILVLSLSLQSCGNKINMSKTLDSNATIKVDAYWEPIADSSLGMPIYSEKHAALFGTLSPAHPSQE